MAVLNPATASQLLYDQGSADTLCLYAIRDVNAGDTLDLGPTGAGQYQLVERAVMIGVDVFVAVACAISGTVITIPAGMSANTGYLLAWGAG